jgi:hypothetical protein
MISAVRRARPNGLEMIRADAVFGSAPSSRPMALACGLATGFEPVAA